MRLKLSQPNLEGAWAELGNIITKIRQKTQNVGEKSVRIDNNFNLQMRILEIMFDLTITKYPPIHKYPFNILCGNYWLDEIVQSFIMSYMRMGGGGIKQAKVIKTKFV